MKMYTFVLALLLCACTSTQRTFYVDSITGDDANKGSSLTEAWKSLDKLNQQVFEPGDRILFKSGTEYVGQFEPKGSGSEGKPVMVDKYGDGGKPILHGDGQKQHTILLEGLEYWELNNLEVTNKGEKPDPGRNGIIIYLVDHVIKQVHRFQFENQQRIFLPFEKPDCQGCERKLYKE